MATAVTSLRAEADYGKQTYVLFIEGIATAYTNDESGDLAGSGLTSWIGVSEQAIINGGGSDEVIGERTVKRGLQLPSKIPFSVDPKTGQLGDSPLTFKILDLDASLRTLFATAGKTSDILFEYVPAGTTALDATLTINNTTTTVDPADKYIGIERIGPNRERNFFPVFPDVAMPGPEHFVNSITPTEPGAIQVSDEPIQFAGRRVALYRIYKDHHDQTGTYDPWPDWLEQFQAGGLVWWGVMEDAGTYEGADMWSIRCLGPSALLQKPIGIRSNMHDGVKISAPLVLSTTAGEDESKVGVYPTATYFDGVLFTTQTVSMDYFDMSKTVTGTDTNSVRANIETFLNDCAAGTGTTGGSLNHMNLPGGTSPLDAVGDMKMEGGSIMIKKADSAAWYTVNIVAHEKVWRTMGFDPVEQAGEVPFENIYGAYFQKLPAGDVLQFADGNVASSPMPGPGYWVGTFDTRRLGWAGSYPSNTYDASNNEQWRRYKAFFNVGVEVLSKKGDQTIVLPGSGSDYYCQGDRCLWLTDGTIGGAAAVTANRAGYFAFKGKIVKEEGGESEDIWQVAVCKWRNAAWAATTGSDDGIIVAADYHSTTGTQGLHIMKWLDPRAFGFESKKLDRDWSFTGLDDGNPIEIYPLSTFAYFEGDEPEFADSILSAIMCSTGTSNGYDGPVGAAIPKMDHGDNDPGDATGSLFMHGDIYNYSMGLAIPEEIIADAADIRKAFPDPGNPFNRVRFAWLGSAQAEDVIKSIMQPRRVGMSLHGRKYTPRRIDNFTAADATIVEADLSGKAGDGKTVIPQVEMRATGPIDKTTISYRYEAEGGGTALERTEVARDVNAKSRTGKVVHALEDWGLMPLGWYSSDVELEQVTGLQTWGFKFRETWGIEAPTWYAKRHFTIRGLPVSRIKGQDLAPLSRIRVTNPWVLDAEGNMGVTTHAGLVLKVNHGTADGKATIDVLMFEDGSGSGTSSYVQPQYAPCARVLGWDATSKVLYCYSDFRGHGDASLSDLTGFTEPTWSSIGGGNAKVIAYYWDGSVNSAGLPSWTQGPENTVSSVDTSANTITMTGFWSSWTDPQGNSQTNLLRDMDWLVVLVNRDHADSPDWCDRIFGFYVDETLATGASTFGRFYL